MPSTKRQRELARRRAERQAARRAEARARRRKRNLLIYGTTFSVVLLLILGLTVGKGLFDDDDGPTTEAFGDDPVETGEPTPSASASPKPFNGTCTYANSGRPASKPAGLPPAKPSLKGTRTGTVVFGTGSVTFQALADKAPCTVNSFAHLASKQYFDNTTCHRLTNSSALVVLQCGDPSGSGSGGPGYQYADENLTGATYPRGTVAMANAGGGTNGSQFFLVIKNSQLPPSYTVWGRVTQGLDVLDKILAAGIEGDAQDGKPKAPVTIKDFRIS